MKKIVSLAIFTILTLSLAACSPPPSKLPGGKTAVSDFVLHS
jgi:starvation-inducible outer membrane lipoprotein